MRKKPPKDKIIELLKKGYTAKDIALLYNASERRGYEWVAEVKNECVITQEDIINAINNAIQKPKLIKPPNITSNGETLIILLSDWHIGSIIKDEQDKEIFNIAIAKERANKLISNIVSLIKNHIFQGTKITDIAIFILGDMVDGENIYPGQAFMLEDVPPFQVMEAFSIINNLLFTLSKFKLPIQVYCVKGNHGSLKEYSNNSNWDIMLYLIIAYYYQNNKLITINYSTANYINCSIRGWKINARHKGIPQLETASGRAKGHGYSAIHNADAIICGHLHHYSISEDLHIRLFMNGSLKGIDEYSETLSKGAIPSQLIFGVTNKRLPSFIYICEVL